MSQAWHLPPICSWHIPFLAIVIWHHVLVHGPCCIKGKFSLRLTHPQWEVSFLGVCADNGSRDGPLLWTAFLCQSNIFPTWLGHSFESLLASAFAEFAGPSASSSTNEQHWSRHRL